MRKGIWILLLVLAALAIFLLLSRQSGSYRSGSHDFSIEDPEAIAAVCLNRGKDSLRLERTENGWRVNGTWMVRQDRLDGLLILLTRLEVRAPVSRQSAQDIAAALRQGTRVHVRLRQSGDKTYQVVYHEPTRATYMRMSRSDETFSMQVRGYDRRNLEQVFDLDENYWRDNAIFRHLPEQIRYFSHAHHRHPERSFRLKRMGAEGNFMLAGLDDSDRWQPPDPDALQQFLAYLADVRFEGFQDTSRTGRIAGTAPIHTLILEDTEGRRTRLELLPASLQTENGDMEPDLHYVFGRLNDERSLVLIKYLEIDLLLKDFGYFLRD